LQSSREEQALLIDGARYIQWSPQREDDLEKQVKEHSKEIFGVDSAYLDLKQRLKSRAGIGSIPDGYVLTFGNEPRWFIAEVELSSHPLYDHIAVQLTKFMNGVANPNSQREIVNAIYEEIGKDEVLKAWIKNRIGAEEIHSFLSNLISQPPIIAVVINERADELQEVCNSLPGEKRILEFQTFVEEGAGLDVHAHLYHPLTISPNRLEVTILNGSFGRFHRLRIPENRRTFFPGYKIPFKIETDTGEIETCVCSARSGTQLGDRAAGRYIEVNLTHWLKKHSGTKVGDTVVLIAVEPLRRYRLAIP
jgi:hypothetical protein